MHDPLADRADIVDQLGRFARILDQRSWDDVADVFAHDVTFDYGSGEVQAGIDELRRRFARFLDGCGPSQHLIGSVVVEIDGATAVSHAYVQARHQGSGDRAHLFYDSNGEYEDRWERRSSGWRIVRRDVRWTVRRGDRGVFRLPEG